MVGYVSGEIPEVTNKDIAYRNQLIVSNIQMTIVLLSVFAMGTAVGFV